MSNTHSSSADHPTTPLPPQRADHPTAAPHGAPYAGHQQPSGYQQASGYGAPAPVQPSGATTLGETNTFALLAIIFAFLSPLAGIIFGHLGLNQIKRNGDGGRGIALTGLIISYAYFVFVLLFFVAYIGILIMIFSMIGEFATSMSNSF